MVQLVDDSLLLLLCYLFAFLMLLQPLMLVCRDLLLVDWPTAWNERTARRISTLKLALERSVD